ncbi:MAG: methyltransferase domain-containing protein [Anaerolineales bacterium]|nr:methyltransferase domain-containing protein [Anaerolineales bacterium]MBP6208645.1 methyltransferase domain-containing protein [Anaerolineales bacterium]
MKNIERGGHFLEIGPGNLLLALEILTKFDKGTLIDFNTTNVEQIYNSLNDGQKQKLKLIIADFFEQDHLNERFDCVVFCEVLEHIQDDAAFLKKVNKTLVEGGQLILSVPSRKIYWSIHDEIVGHCRRYEKNDLQEKLINAGYTQIKIISYGFPFVNIARIARIALAKIQYNEKSRWDQKTKTQQSSFNVKPNPLLDWVAIIINKYTFYPLSLLAAAFNDFDLSDGYVVSAFKSRS